MLSLPEVFIRLSGKSRGADGEKDEVVLAGVGDPLGAQRRDDDHVVWSHVSRWLRSHRDSSTSCEDNVALNGVVEPVQARRHSRFDASSGNGDSGICGGVVQLEDEAPLLEVVLLGLVMSMYGFVGHHS